MKIHPAIQFFFKSFCLSLVVFTIFRFLLLLSEIGQFESSQIKTVDVILALLMGLRFDIVITGYLMIIPFVLVAIASILDSRILLKFSSIFIIIFFPIAFLVAAVDIPFFNQFFARFNISAFQWAETPDFVLIMIFEEIAYWWVILPFLIFSAAYVFMIIRYRISAQKKPNAGSKPWVNAIVLLLVALSLFVGIRGRVALKSPIRIGTAYFSDNAFINQLGLNPVFTLMESYFNSFKNENAKLDLVQIDLAINSMQYYFEIKQPMDKSPIARKYFPDFKNSNRPNIVIVIMESMSAAKMQRYGCKFNTTPFLDSLARQSLVFDNCYTNGIHTHNGIYSTLFGYPALKSRHTMNSVAMPKIDGIASTLKEYNYRTMYFTTHDDQFDNVGGFLRNNGFDEIVAQSAYPAEEVKTALGVPDDYVFRYSISHINETIESDEPFLAVYMTSSDHGPYYIPDYFTPKNSEIKKGIVEYADWSLAQFISMARRQPWFDNTIFAFVADHGSAIDPIYSLPLNYHHTPLIFYSPRLIIPQERKELCSQLDVFPTLMELAKLPYINNTFGVEQLSCNRQYCYFCADNKFGVLSDRFFLIIDENGESLFEYKSKSTENVIEKYPGFALDMRNYLNCNLQAAQYMIEKKLSKLR